MKNYTFKIKSYKEEEYQVSKDTSKSFHPVIVSICCPLEVLYDSIKVTPELSDFDGFITQTDFVETFTNDDGTSFSSYVSYDQFLGDVRALFNSKDLKDFLVNNRYIAGFGEFDNDFEFPDLTDNSETLI